MNNIVMTFYFPPKPCILFREETGGVFKEGFKSAQTTVHSTLSGGKICCCNEEAAVWSVEMLSLGCVHVGAAAGSKTDNFKST